LATFCDHFLASFGEQFGYKIFLQLATLIMADEEGNGDIDDEKPTDQTVKKAAKHDSVRATDLEKVTDYVEEAEISSNNISDVSDAVTV